MTGTRCTALDQEAHDELEAEQALGTPPAVAAIPSTPASTSAATMATPMPVATAMPMPVSPAAAIQQRQPEPVTASPPDMNRGGLDATESVPWQSGTFDMCNECNGWLCLPKPQPDIARVLRLLSCGCDAQVAAFIVSSLGKFTAAAAWIAGTKAA